MIKRSRARLAVPVLVLLALGAAGAQAQPYPSKPITLIVPFAAGGALDATARALAAAARDTALGQPIQVVNRPGAGGTLAAAEVAEAKADGYTIVLFGPAQPLVHPQMRQLSYGFESFDAIMMVMSWPFVLAVQTSAKWQTPHALLAHLKERPGQVNVGISGGKGTVTHLVGEALQQQAAVKWNSIFFPRGDAEGVPALLGGHVEAFIGVAGNIAPHAAAGKLKGLIVFADERSKDFPDTPTARELGHEVGLQPYVFLMGPKGLPPGVVETLNQNLGRAMASRAFHDFADGKGFTVSSMGAHELKQRLQRDYATFGGLIKALGLKE